MIAHELDDKENLSPVRFGASNKSPDGKKKKARSKSIGPGGLEEADASKHSSPDRNRRKSVASTVKSILPSKEDETKRREARRKSLANRRVSFAPEATLHTWDVIEYMRDATTSSSASSEAARRASSTYDGPESDPPSTPPEQADDDSELPDSPEHQRDAHQQKRRRSSAIPPMNFNNLDEDYSSSPVSGSSDAAASSEVEEDVDSDDDGESTAMSLDQGDDTMASQDSGNSTGSSARLDAALRQAADQAGTRGIDFDEYGDMSMEMAGDEITNAFKPWSQGQHFAVEDQENVNPFASVFKPGQPIEEDEEDDMSMDMTRAVGRILPQQQLPQHQEHNDNNDDEDEGDMTMDMTRPVGAIWPATQPAHEEGDDSVDMTMDMTRPVGGILQLQRPSPERTVSFGDETMDLTQAIGKIHQWNPSAQPPRSALKRRLSAITTEEGSPLTNKITQDSQKRTVADTRDAKRRRSSSSRLSLGDGTMDFTMAVGSIQQRQSPIRASKRQSLNSRRSSAASSAMDEQTMEFTVAAGGIIKQSPVSSNHQTIVEEDLEENENISMELASVLGKIQDQADQGIERPATPHQSSSPVRAGIPTTPKDQGRFKEANDHSARKILTPVFVTQASNSAVKDSARSRRSSARKSPIRGSAKSPAFLSPGAAGRTSRSSAQKTPSSVPKSTHSTPGFLSPAQNSPASQPSPLPLRQSGSGQTTPSFQQSPASRSQQSLSVTKSPAPKSPSRKSPASVRRSTRKMIATEHSQEAIVTPSEPTNEAQPHAAEMQLEDALLDSPVAKTEQTPNDEERDKISYPVLPKTEFEFVTTPLSPKIPATESPAHHHAEVAVTGSPMRTPSMTTPKQIDLEELNPPSPSLEKQLRSSPVKFATTPDNVPSEEPTRNFADSIRLLSTPRKDTGTSPLKRLRTLTPKKSPAKKAMTPRKVATPKAYTPPTANKSATQIAGMNIANDMFAVPKSSVPPTKVHLNEFLDLAGIKFMELTASKRRHTVAPQSHDLQGAGEDHTIDLEGAVVAGACTMPMLDLFQHACRELKRYISEGKSFLKTLEVEVYEESPPFFQAYVNASPERKSQLDGHMRNAKTSARLQSKEIWYDWRSKLLDGLEDGLNRIKAGLDEDTAVLGQKEEVLDSMLPDLLQQYETLQKEAEQLEEAAAATSEEEKEELRESRDRLVQVDVEMEERKRMLASLQRDMEEQDDIVEAYDEGKAECLAAIQEAERVKDSCRGFTIDEVQALKGSVAQLEEQTGWSVTLASGSNLTMTYRNSLQLFFDTSSFKLHAASKACGRTGNSPISLTYTGASADQSLPSALTTEKRFYLQLMRAQLQCLEQNATSIKSLLEFVGNGWDTATRVAEQIRRLNLEHMVSVSIHSDEKLGVDINVMLPKVETKVRIALQLKATTTNDEADVLDVKTEVTVGAKVVYGEAYNEKNMSEFVGKRIARAEEFDGWDEAIRELRVRLVATGRKGR